MQRALDLAEKGRGTTRPNPLVGAVIVKNGRIVGEGYHRRAGSDHAEIVALKQAGPAAKGATLYVTLEPCCHTGRTGPCTDRIIAAKIARVVFAVRDPDPRVRGRGARRLREAGVEVNSGLLGAAARLQNDIFFHYSRNRTPFVILKSAQTLDGRIATCTGDSRWITSEASRKIAHRMRAEVDAVVVGGGTVRIDNPALTVRHVKGDNPWRIVASSSLDFPDTVSMLDNEDGRTIVASSRTAIERFQKRRRDTSHLVFWTLESEDGYPSLKDLIAHAANAGMRALLVEGGATLHTAFLRQGLAHKYVQFVAPKIIGRGIDGVADLGIERIDSAITLSDTRYQAVGNEMIVSGYLPREN